LMLLLILLIFSVSSQEIFDLSFFGSSRLIRGHHLFPNYFSPSSSFFSLPSKDEYAISYIHTHIGQINDVISDVSMDNMLIKSICSYSQEGETYYVVNTGSGEGRHEIALNLTMKELQESMKTHTESQVEVSHICSNGRTFDVVWHHAKNFVQHFIVEESPLKEVMNSSESMAREGYYPSTIQSFIAPSTPRALVIWRKGFGVKGRLYLSSISPVNREGHISVWRDDGFSWRNRTIPRSIRLGSFDLSALDWEVESEIRRQEVPSISISVQYSNQTLFERSYGYADLVKEIEATTSHRYRIASVSKTITAMLVTHLVNAGKISYGDRVFGPNGILSSLYRGPMNIYLRSITVQNLLEHSSGAWSHFMKLEFTKRELTNSQFLYWILASNQPTIPPGRVHIYSNIGYIFLGRVIEAVSGMTYETFARQSLFRPLNIEGAAIADRVPLSDEVNYYSHDNASPYLSWSPRRLDAAAGWTLKAGDIARVMSELNTHRNGKYRLMVVRGWTRWNYGRGVQIGNDGSIYHMGSMAGSESLAYSKGRLSIGLVANLRGTRENWLTPWMESVARRLSTRFQ
ncbi:hypothetical protein PFISCL1PPCAC_2013, partial [Pristionchus fissidentatus]